MTDNTKIEKVDFNLTKPNVEYFRCTFEHCDFSTLRLDNTIFDECEFRYCNFSLTKFANTILDSRFVECKMTGADFSDLSRSTLSLNFAKCHLTYASFGGLKIRNSAFEECNLAEVTFDNADLTSTVFDRCNLERASFAQTNLEKADFSTSYNYVINPGMSKLRKAIFSESGLRGLLSHLDIKITR